MVDSLTATNRWEFWSLVAMLVFQTIKQYMDQRANAAAAAQIQQKAIDATESAENARLAAARAASVASSGIREISAKQDELKETTNCKIDQLIEAARRVGFSAGVLVGIKQEQERTATPESGPIDPDNAR